MLCEYGPRTPYASVKPVRRRSQAAWPTKETVSNLSEPADSELEEDPLEALLKAKYPNVNGLYATTSLALLSTLPEPAQGFVQILNVSANHWVTTDHRARKSTSGPMQEV
ncbi:unnamed protein product [Boreogadus saida]